MTGDGNAMLHTDDGAIVQWIDGALSRDERAALDTHFADCAECASRRAVIARRGQRLGKHLRETDLPVPAPALRVTLDSRTRKGIPVQWKIAAVLVLALAGAVAVPEVRAWILAWTRTIGGRNAVPAQGAPPHAGAVSFVPEGPMLTIRVPPR